MQIGVVGLGRMGANISRRLMKAGHSSVVWDANPAAIDDLGKDGATTATGLQDLVGKLSGSPRAVWVMLPHGKITEDTIETLSGLLAKGDIIIDGGNTYYKDDIRRGKALAAKGLALYRCRHLRRRLGPGPRLLPDDRRRDRRGEAPRSDLCRTRARDRHDRAHARPRRPRSARRTGLYPCRPGRCRALRQDDP